MNISVVTTVWGDYSCYIPRWLESLEAQTTPPTDVIILDAGSADPKSVVAAASEYGARVVKADYEGMGCTRNAAVSQTSTEWVMHLDADDTLLPHALTDIAELAPECDVVSIGAYRGNRVQVFPGDLTKKVRKGKFACFSCAAFKRSFWEESPWLTENDWIDSVFWVGLVKAGARIKGTSRPGFVYQQHEDSFSRQLTTEDRKKARDQWMRALRR